MQLLPEELRAQLPKLYSQENSKDPIVHVKFFTPDSNWTWYVTEGEPDGDDFRFFGYVFGFESEGGYFVLPELETTRGPLGVRIERDLYFEPRQFSAIRELNRDEYLPGSSTALTWSPTPSSRRIIQSTI